MAPPSTTGANKRRRTSGNTSAASQSTISFTNPTKPSAAKPSSRPSKTAEKPSKPLEAQKPASADIALPSRPSQAELSGDVVPAAVEEEEAELDSEDEREAEDEAAAAKITDKQIKLYWAAKEDARKAPRVHQAGLSVRERVCREFDMELRFGPCTGIPRLHRWKRARNLGLNPPIEVLAVFRKELEDGAKSAKGKKGEETANARGQKSIMDELIMSSRLKAGELDV